MVRKVGILGISNVYSVGRLHNSEPAYNKLHEARKVCFDSFGSFIVQDWIKIKCKN